MRTLITLFAMAFLLGPAALAQDEAARTYAEVCFAQQDDVLVADLARAEVALGHTHRERTAMGVETCAVLNDAEQARLAQRAIPHRLAV
ncbi:MAG: hypothetical protein AAFQ86_17395, partial [Bacteroidota bacterium]